MSLSFEEEEDFKDKKHICEICEHRFKRRFTLQEHMKIHTGEKPFPCIHEGCDKKFSTSGNLSRHRKVHQKKMKELPGVVLPAPSTEELLVDEDQLDMEPLPMYPCPECHQIFLLKEEMTRHEKSHHKKKYSCPRDGCPKLFTSPGNLARHVKSHDKKRAIEIEKSSIKKAKKGRKARLNVVLQKCAIQKKGNPFLEIRPMPALPKLDTIQDVQRHDRPTVPRYSNEADMGMISMPMYLKANPAERFGKNELLHDLLSGRYVEKPAFMFQSRDQSVAKPVLLQNMIQYVNKPPPMQNMVRPPWYPEATYKPPRYIYQTQSHAPTSTQLLAEDLSPRKVPPMDLLDKLLYSSDEEMDHSLCSSDRIFSLEVNSSDLIKAELFADSCLKTSVEKQSFGMVRLKEKAPRNSLTHHGPPIA